MKILFITSNPLEYNTSANIRNMGLIGGLVKNGAEIYTLSPYPKDQKFFSGKILQEPFKKRFWLNSPETIKVDTKSSKKHMKFKTFLLSMYSSFSIYDRKASFAKKVHADIVGEYTFDIIISSSDPKSSHLIAEKLIKEKKSICNKWIQYWGDPFLNDVSHKRLFRKGRIRNEEARLLAEVDKAVYVSPFTADELRSLYPKIKEKIAFLPIPYKEEGEQISRRDGEIGYVAYLGNYGSVNRNIKPLVEAINKGGIKAAIIGNSDVRIESNSHLIVRDRMPVDELKEITSNVEVFVCLCNNGGTQIPGKVYHYVNTGKPILIILDGDNQEQLKAYFESYNRFYICENNSDAILYTLKTIISERKIFQTPDSLNPTTIAREFIAE